MTAAPEAGRQQDGDVLEADPRAALTRAHTILRDDPANTAALFLAAAAHRALGEERQAMNAEMAGIAASERAPALIEAARALDRKDYPEAARRSAEYLATEPGNLAALTLSAEAALAMDRPDDAEPKLAEVVRRAPPFDAARRLLFDALMQLDRLTEARDLLDEAAQGQTERSGYLRMRWQIENELGNHQAAAGFAARLAALSGARPDDWLNYGESLRFTGDREGAIAAYRKVLETDPAYGRAWWSLADIDPMGIDNEDVEALGSALAQNAEDPEHGANINFALGLTFDARGDAERAFPHFARGNQLRKEAYSADELTRQVDRHLAISAASPAQKAVVQPGPVFIVGMPRSGSTLVERILGRHSQVEALGELSIVPHMVQRLKRDHGDRLEERIGDLSENELADLRQWYLDRAAEHRKTDKPFFIDKLHMNWKHLPLILRMLPQARIVDVRRGALDCCWSNYKTLFARGHPAASDMHDLGRFYRDYVRLTDALRAGAPDRIHLLDYERLVGDIEGETRALFAAIGIPFEQQCLEFHLSAEPVATASSEQVRRPLNRNGIGAWLPYERWLGPLKDALGDLAQVPC